MIVIMVDPIIPEIPVQQLKTAEKHVFAGKWGILRDVNFSVSFGALHAYIVIAAVVWNVTIADAGAAGALNGKEHLTAIPAAEWSCHGGNQERR